MQMNPEKSVIGELEARICTMEPLLGNEIECYKELTLKKRKAAATAAATATAATTATATAVTATAVTATADTVAFCSLNKL
jgi:hypothetical protein